MVEIAKTPFGRFRWILNDIDSIWYNTLCSIALNLICQYAVMSVPAPRKGHEIFYVPLHNVLRSILIFKDGFKELTLKQKLMLLVVDIGIDLSRISLNIPKYNSDSDAMLSSALESMSLLKGTPLPSVRACAAFVDVTNKTEIVCKKAANKEEKVILEK